MTIGLREDCRSWAADRLIAAWADLDEFIDNCPTDAEWGDRLSEALDDREWLRQEMEQRGLWP